MGTQAHRRMHKSIGLTIVVTMGAVACVGDGGRSRAQSANGEATAASKQTAKAQATARHPSPGHKMAKATDAQAAKHQAAKQASAEAKGGAAIAHPGAAMQPMSAPRLLPGEVEHAARFDAAIAPTRDYTISSDDTAALRAAIQAVAAARVADAKALRVKITDPAAAKIVDWSLLRAGWGTAAEFRAFMEANPVWPDRAMLNQRAEQALFSGPASSGEIKAFFADREPRTAVGLAALASAFLADKDVAHAKALAVKAWSELEVPASLEPAFLKRVGALLTEADHKRRLDRLLLNDSRWTGERAERALVIRRVIGLLSEEEKKKAEARLAVFLRVKNSAQLMAKLPVHTHSDWGLTVQRAQALRRQKKDEDAWTLLLAEPHGSVDVKPDGWWEERRVNAYGALKAGKTKLAYDLVREPGPLSVNAAKDAAFMAGWLALRQLKDAKLALGHFQALRKAADGPLSYARAHYWLGRTYEALGEQDKAQGCYQAAAAYIDTFHGQLARLKLDPRAHALKITPPAAPTQEEMARFNALDAARAAVIARKAGLDSALPRAFLYQLRNSLQSEAEIAMVAHLAEALGDTQTAVRIGKTAIARGQNLFYYAYPIHSLPPYTPLRRPPEPAFILAIARQESEFNTLTQSGAGARGILQVMPVTANHVCHDYKIKCEMARLLHDPAYNTMMGSAYISDRMDEFTGSYVLTLAGYNAGPGRARQWIKEFGDPRDAKIDPIDWIHRIPFEETREYVQKVLSNIQVYRARLGDEANALRLTSDLKRESAAQPATFLPAPAGQ
jgi:soluble lytic murein transglycosylase